MPRLPVIAAFHGALLTRVSKAVIVLCRRFPRADAIPAGAIIVARLLLAIRSNPKPRCYQHIEARWLVTEVAFRGAYIPTASGAAGLNCSL